MSTGRFLALKTHVGDTKEVLIIIPSLVTSPYNEFLSLRYLRKDSVFILVGMIVNPGSVDIVFSSVLLFITVEDLRIRTLDLGNGRYSFFSFSYKYEENRTLLHL